ncbi:MAG: Ni/Fe hydrogenase subunit alpha [Sulfurimonas sp.]|nr:Ni/Fe hydrogenase subunit alpha [Sulfurimonas sp.]MDD3061015.1 Ni/Fe hydrogenase subunit alpha [Sulfurimonas sp.]MDD5203140.1 Ni/Fe hydrogenase subunit alpha [Sulfurimonas sp.]
MKKIIIDPVTRIEGHAKITIDVDANNRISDAKIHVTQFRGFEKFCEGQIYSQMPALTARTCGICPVSHAISSIKACDILLGVTPPQAGINLRKIINLAQILQSHTLSFFHLSSPDFIYGFDAKKEDRNIFKMMQTHPQMAKDGIMLRAFGQKVIQTLGGKRIHPDGLVPGGVEQNLDTQTKNTLLLEIPNAIKIAEETLIFFKNNLAKFEKEIDSFGVFPSLFMALVDENGNLEHYDGKLKIIDSEGNVLQENISPQHYKEFIGEAVEAESYLKSPYYKPFGYPQGMYRVGALARLNIAKACGTPKADKELLAFKALNAGKPVLNSFYYHYARLIEMLYALEKIELLLKDETTMGEALHRTSKILKTQAVGCSEAPRGTLFHDYEVDTNGIIQKVNLIIATGNNNLAMNAGLKQVAQTFINAEDVSEGALNRVEALIRCFDPCLSCSTHALGIVSSNIELKDHNKNIIQIFKRN